MVYKHKNYVNPLSQQDSLHHAHQNRNIVSAGTYDSISEFFRVAVDEHLARYTDIPTLLSLDRRVKLNKAQIDKLSESDRTQNRRITQIEEKIR